MKTMLQCNNWLSLRAEEEVARAAAGEVASDAAACTPPRVVRCGTMEEWRALAAAVLAVAAAAAAAAAAFPTPRVVAARVTKGESPALEAVAAAAAVTFPPPGVVVRVTTVELTALAAVAADEAAAVAASAAAKRAWARW